LEWFFSENYYKEYLMVDYNNDLSACVTRMKHLETQCLYLRVGLGILTIGNLIQIAFTCVILLSWVPQQQQTNNQDSMPLRDSQGALYAMFQTGQADLYGDNALPRISLQARKSGGHISILDDHLRSRVFLGITNPTLDTSESSIGLCDDSGNPRAALIVNNKETNLTLFDAKKRPRLVIRVDENGPCISMLDEEGKMVKTDLMK
jgi:hypothetical protein